MIVMNRRAREIEINRIAGVINTSRMSQFFRSYVLLCSGHAYQLVKIMQN